MSDCTCNSADKHASGECPVHIWGDGPLYEAKVNRIAKERDLCRAALLAVETDHTDRCMWCRAGRGPDPKTGWHTGPVMHLPTCQRQVALGLAPSKETA